MMPNNLIKLVLSILFLLCLLNMPYGFYELVRFLAMIGFAFLTYQHYNQEEKKTALVYAALALLFQPFSKIALGRELWNIVDVVVAVGLLASMFYSSTKKNDLTTNRKWK